MLANTTAQLLALKFGQLKQGRGNWGHAGRPGFVGGSAARIPNALMTPAYARLAKKRQSEIPAIAEQALMKLQEMGHDEFSTPQEVVDAALTTYRRLINDGELSVRVPYSTFLKILQTGRFKSQHETRRAEGLYDPEFRESVEEENLGVPADIPKTERPIFGYIETGYPGLDSGAEYYGVIRCVLKDELKDRSTTTFGDSLNARGICVASPMRNPSIISVASGMWNSRADSYVSLAANRPEDFEEDVEYIEAQIHGGVKVSDIEKVVVLRDDLNADELQNLREVLSRAGISADFRDRKNA